MKEMSKQEQDRWVAEHADQFENDCRPLGRETGIRTPDWLQKEIDAHQEKGRSEQPPEHSKD